MKLMVMMKKLLRRKKKKRIIKYKTVEKILKRMDYLNSQKYMECMLVSSINASILLFTKDRVKKIKSEIINFRLDIDEKKTEILFRNLAKCIIYIIDLLEEQ
jgi:hypothetical protein